MSKIISVQCIRDSLATIADQAQAGETFTVVRNSKPVFKIVPPDQPGHLLKPTSPTLGELTGRLDKVNGSHAISHDELDMIIHEAHEEYGRK